MGKLKQTYTIDLYARYGLACEIEGRELTDDEYMDFCDGFSVYDYDPDEYDVLDLEEGF